MISADHKRCSTRPSADRPNYDLAKVFFVALRGQKEVAVAVAVLRGPPCPPWTKVLPLPFFVALSVLRGSKEVFFVALRGPPWTKGSCSRRCSSPRPSVSSVDKCAAVAVLRGPSWTKEVAVAVTVLRGPPCPPWTKVLPLPFFVALSVLRGSKEVFFVALRGPPWTKGSCSRRCSSPRPSVSSVDKCAAVAVLRGPSWTKEVAVAVTVLRGPPCPPWTKVLPLPFFVALRGPSWTKGNCSRRCSSPRPSVSSVDKCAAVAVLRGPSCPPWTNVLPLQFFVALRGQKEVAVAVAVLRGPPCPPWTNVLPLQFFVALRGQRKLQSPLQFSAALRVLRGQMCCRCSSSRPSVALRGQKEVTVAVAVLRGPPCPPWTKVLPLPFFVALRGPSWTKGSCSRRCSSPRPSVSSVDKCVAVAVLRGPSWPFVEKGSPPLALRGQTKL